jgi:hypothetical protein
MRTPFWPGRLGADFTRLWTASAVSNLGDGVTGVAGPLLVASLTDSPALVAGAAFAQQLPWLLFSLPAGAWVDRVEAGAQLVLALTRVPWVAGATLVLFGIHATVWGVVSVSVRQRIVPEELRGRVNSVYFLFDLGGAAVGTLLGAGVASAVGITAPFWLGSLAVALLALATWRRFARAQA